MDRPAWSKERIVEALKQNSFGYQNVRLPHGLETGGDDRSETAEAIFPKRLDGKSVFDLGCRYGFFCFFAEDRGAETTVGAEIDAEYVRKCTLLAEMKQSGAAFERFDIETDQFSRQFDYVLCLNVLHHLRNPLSALEKLIHATRETLVLETAGFHRRDRRKNKVSAWMALVLSRLPLFYIARNSAQTFFITVPALQALLLEKRADFARVDVIKAGHKGRPILLAHRYRIGRLVIVAGFPASGKSTFIEHLTSGKNSQIAQDIGFDTGRKWKVLQFGRLRENTEPELGDVVLHYNISGRLMNSELYQYSHALSDLMSVAQSITVVTLACPRQRLLQQFMEGRAGKAEKFLSPIKRKKKMQTLIELYNNTDSLEAMYADWFSFLDKKGVDSKLVKHDGAAYTASRPESLAGY